MTRSTFLALTMGTVLLGAVGTQEGEAQMNSKTASKTGDIVEMATAAGSFTTLAKALQAAGLVETLKGPGPFTVFAPTDEAFARLPQGTLEGLLANPDKLKAVLTYHVVPGRLNANQVVTLSVAPTVNGQSVRVHSKDGAVMIDDAKVIRTDVLASNGVIHVIDKVLLPK